jgi:cytochrome c oxidase cbb3-type subunit 4
MTIGIVRSLLTVILFAAFIALWIWAWSKRRHEDFTAAARLPLEDEMQSSTRNDVT